VADQPTPQEVAEAAAEVAAVTAAFSEPGKYNSRERGPGIPIDSMNPCGRDALRTRSMRDADPRTRLRSSDR
jgi:hypothetical protein